MEIDTTSLNRKNAELHSLFPDLNQEETYITVVNCALQKDILLQGRLFLTQHYLAFHSNIFGFITTLIIPFNEIKLIEKRMTIIIPNAISISTIDNWYFFTSFMTRDQTYAKIVNLWNQNIPLVSGSLENSQILGSEVSLVSDDEGRKESVCEPVSPIESPVDKAVVKPRKRKSRPLVGSRFEWTILNACVLFSIALVFCFSWIILYRTLDVLTRIDGNEDILRLLRNHS